MPGPDIIPNKALKVIVKTRSDIFVELLEVGLVNGTFPKVWKYQKLMFLPKGLMTIGVPSYLAELVDRCLTGRRL